MTMPDELLVYVGTRAGTDDHIHCLALDPLEASLSKRVTAEPAANPSFVLLHPSGHTAYAVNEAGGGPSESGAISAYAVDSDGRLHFIASRLSGGGAPCHLSLSPGEKHLFAANYSGGSIAVFAIEPDGRLGPLLRHIQHEGGSNRPGRDAGPHVHWTSLDAAGRRLAVTDLGRDEVLVYAFEPAHPDPLAAPPACYRFEAGSGPRHAVFLAGGRQLAVVTEFASTATLLDYDAPSGRLDNPRQVSTLPPGWHGENFAAEIAVSPDERFLYASNRGHDSIAVIALDQAAGTPALLGTVPTGGRWPRHFAIDPTGRILITANQRSNDLRTFRRDTASGMIEPSSQVYSVPAPTCIAFRRAGP